MHAQGIYVCTGRFCAGVATQNTLCPACIQRGRDTKARARAARKWNTKWAAVVAWVVETQRHEQDVHPQWVGTLGSMHDQMAEGLEAGVDDG